MAGLERSKDETGPTRTGTISLQSCMRGKKKSYAGIIFHKRNGDPIILLLNLRSHNQHNYKEMKAALVDGQIILQTAKLALVCTKKN